MRIEDRLTKEQCDEIAARILRSFGRRCAGGTQYGYDWPTMRVLFPTSCRVFTRLKNRYVSLVKNPGDVLLGHMKG